MVKERKVKERKKIPGEKRNLLSYFSVLLSFFPLSEIYK